MTHTACTGTLYGPYTPGRGMGAALHTELSTNRCRMLKWNHNCPDQRPCMTPWTPHQHITKGRHVVKTPASALSDPTPLPATRPSQQCCGAMPGRGAPDHSPGTSASWRGCGVSDARAAAGSEGRCTGLAQGWLALTCTAPARAHRSLGWHACTTPPPFSPVIYINRTACPK
jgi:hypothetical protein